MEKELIASREAVMDKVDLALDSAWPERTGEAFIKKMSDAVSRLQSIAEQMNKEGVSKTEIGRTYTSLGSVYSDLKPSLGIEMLHKAKDAYLKAESYLKDCKDELILAKFNFNYANTLRQIDPNNTGLLAEARLRYEYAEEHFSALAPQYLPLVSEGIVSVNNLLLLAPISNKINKKKARVDEINKSIHDKGNATEVMKDFGTIEKEDGGISGLVGELYGVIISLDLKPENKEKLKEIQNSLNKISIMAGKKYNTDETDQERIFKALKERLRKESESGRVDPDRLKILGELIYQFENQTGPGTLTIEELLLKVQQQREIIRSNIEMMHYLSHGIPRPPEGSSAARLIERCWLLRRFIFEEMARSEKGPEESNRAQELNIKSSKVDKMIYEAGSDDKKADRVDIDMLRPFALETRNFSSRLYPMIAKPIWSSVKETVDVKEIFYSGTSQMGKKFTALVKQHGYIVQDKPQGHSFAESRWHQLQKSMTAVFDLRSAKELDMAAITYELGIALSIGKPIIIVINENDWIPFDIEIKPVTMTGQTDDDELLVKAIDESLAWTYPWSSEKPYLTTLDNVLSSYKRPLPNTYADQTFKMLQDQKAEGDPLLIDRLIIKFFEYLNDGKTMVIYPFYAPFYPNTGAKKVFHITPFRPDWAPKTRDQIRKTCKRMKFEYIRGDEAKDPNIIRSIWTEIAIASHIVVDLTGFNPNVTLELGIAHTLGKQILMVGLKETTDKLFPMISKLRTIPYIDQKQDGRKIASYDKPEDLDKIVSDFLKQ
jgi:hypothetical protein